MASLSQVEALSAATQEWSFENNVLLMASLSQLKDLPN